jgi:hypothetical protein
MGLTLLRDILRGLLWLPRHHSGDMRKKSLWAILGNQFNTVADPNRLLAYNFWQLSHLDQHAARVPIVNFDEAAGRQLFWG